jgi:hypothetical protein
MMMTAQCYRTSMHLRPRAVRVAIHQHDEACTLRLARCRWIRLSSFGVDEYVHAVSLSVVWRRWS